MEGPILKPDLQLFAKEAVWDMPESGKVINGRYYTKHVLERMAPDTPQVRAELTKRAHEYAIKEGHAFGSEDYIKEMNNYIRPRNIPPMVIENIIKTVKGVPGKIPGTIDYITKDIHVSLNELGDVVTVWAK